VAPLVETSVQMLQARAAEAGVCLAVAVAPDTPDVDADSGRILQVLGNLIGNALKYTPAGGTITVGAKGDGEEVLLWVSDTGAGIAARHLPHLFDRFWHMRGASRTRGSGLGLAIARGIVAAHGGRIWVESTVGEGSTFRFTLPRRNAAPRTD
jgi:signal transduction histidine kinase